MPRIQGRVEPNQPSPRAMLFIKNRNNINDMRLRRTLESFDRERVTSITNIDHDRLDVKDFLKGVKHCASDQLPESKLWLGEKNALRKKREEAQRNIFTAPAGTRKGRGAERDVKTAPEQESKSNKSDSDIVRVGIFFKKKRDVDPNKVHMDIYSKRNMYSTIDRARGNVFGQMEEEEEEAKRAEAEEQQRKWAQEEERQRKAADEKRVKEEAEKRAVELAEERRRSEAVDILTLERPDRPQSDDSDSRRRTGIRAEMRRIAGIGPQSELEKRESRIRAMNDNAELMKEILIKNAKKRAAKKRSKSPLEDRIRTFFTRIDDLRKTEEEEQNKVPTRLEQQRRYVLMTKGVKAALELKDDFEDEENPAHTV